MAKQKRIKIESTDSEGKQKIVYFKLPASEENKSAQLAYNKAFREALQSGAILRQKLAHVMEEQGVWNEAKEAQYVSILEKINDGEKALSKGGISLAEAREIAIEMRRQRVEFRALIAERSSMDSNTAEGQADNERFSHLVYTCLLNEKGENQMVRINGTNLDIHIPKDFIFDFRFKICFVDIINPAKIQN